MQQLARQFAGRPLTELADHLVRVAPQDFLASAPVVWVDDVLSPTAKTTSGPRALGDSGAPQETVDPTLASTLKVPVLGARLSPGGPALSFSDIELHSYLGGGQFGCVYSGILRSTGLAIAVKVLRADRPENASDQGQRAIQEAIIGAKLTHRNIMSIFDVRAVGDFWIILMELIHGRRLAEVRVGSDHIVACFTQLADAVLHMTNKQIIHRDIKPANIVVRKDDSSPLIVDFGLSVDLRVTSSTTLGFAGTPFYMPPEAFPLEPSVTLGFDAYSLGVTACEVLVPDLGSRLAAHYVLNAAVLAHAKASGEFNRFIDACLKGQDRRMRAWILRLLSHEPDQRIAALRDSDCLKRSRWDVSSFRKLCGRVGSILRRP